MSGTAATTGQFSLAIVRQPAHMWGFAATRTRAHPPSPHARGLDAASTHKKRHSPAAPLLSTAGGDASQPPMADARPTKRCANTNGDPHARTSAHATQPSIARLVTISHRYVQKWGTVCVEARTHARVHMQPSIQFLRMPWQGVAWLHPSPRTFECILEL
eukprot:366126-Chlamydomonas_euryale.AAC.13